MIAVELMKEEMLRGLNWKVPNQAMRDPDTNTPDLALDGADAPSRVIIPLLIFASFVLPLVAFIGYELNRSIAFIDFEMLANRISLFYMWIAPLFLLAFLAAAFLIKGPNAGDLHISVGIFLAGIQVAIRMCFVYHLFIVDPHMLEPIRCYKPNPEAYRVLLPYFWMASLFCLISALGLIRVSHLLPEFWTTLRNKTGVCLYVTGILLAISLTFPVARFIIGEHRWGFNYMKERCEENINATDDTTREWIKNNPRDWQLLMIRAYFLRNIGRIEEAKESYEKAISNLPLEDMANSPELREKVHRWRDWDNWEK